MHVFETSWKMSLKDVPRKIFEKCALLKLLEAFLEKKIRKICEETMTVAAAACARVNICYCEGRRSMEALCCL